MSSYDLWMTAVRAVAVYGLALLVIRIMGKRTVGNFTAFDLLVALMLGEVVDEIIYGEVPFAQGAVAILTIASAHYANSWLSYWGHGFDKLHELQRRRGRATTHLCQSAELKRREDEQA